MSFFFYIRDVCRCVFVERFLFLLASSLPLLPPLPSSLRIVSLQITVLYLLQKGNLQWTEHTLKNVLLFFPPKLSQLIRMPYLSLQNVATTTGVPIEKKTFPSAPFCWPIGGRIR